MCVLHFYVCVGYVLVPLRVVCVYLSYFYIRPASLSLNVNPQPSFVLCIECFQLLFLSISN